MKRSTLVTIVILILLALGLAYFFNASKQSDSESVSTLPTACTTEAMICPDGSAVGRQGPKCEFAPCPTPAATTTPPPQTKSTTTEFITLDPKDYPQGHSGIIGVVTIGPTCPVIQNPPEDSCKDRPYQTTLLITSSLGKKTYTYSNSRGEYAAHLEPGTYTISAGTQVVMPTLAPVTFTVKRGEFQTLNLVFDSGIR